MWTWTSVSLTIKPALSPPHVPATWVIGVEVAAEQARSAKIDGIAVIRVMPNGKRVVPLRSSLTSLGAGRSRGVDTLRNDIVLLGES